MLATENYHKRLFQDDIGYPRLGMSGLPGLKCLSMTSGSVELRFVICTPSLAA